MNICEEIRVHKQRRRRVVRGVPYPGGVGGPTTRPAPYRSCLRLASVFSKDTKSLGSRRKYFEKTLATFWGRSGVPPVVAPEGGSALPRVKPSVPPCSFAPSPRGSGRFPKSDKRRVLPYYFGKLKMRLRTI